MNRGVRTFFQFSLFPILLGLLIGSSVLLIQKGFSPSVTVLMTTTVLFFVIWRLETVFPYEESWNQKDPERFHDIGHAFFGTAVGGSAGDWLVKTLAAPLGLWVLSATHFKLWPSEIPLGFQILLIYLVADFGRYWQHRLHHRYPFFWRYHVLHHSTPQMNVFKTSRSHFFERVLQQIFMYSVLALIGAPPEAVMWYLIPNSLLGLLDHSNLDVRLGFLEYFMMGPNAHRLHHSIDRTESDHNFGSALVLWDQVFGTFRYPKAGIRKVGIKGGDFPREFSRQVLGLSAKSDRQTLRKD